VQFNCSQLWELVLREEKPLRRRTRRNRYSQQKLTQAVQTSIIIPTNQGLSFASCLKLSFRIVEYPYRTLV
jgi:hypothetical protein